MRATAVLNLRSLTLMMPAVLLCSASLTLGLHRTWAAAACPPNTATGSAPVSAKCTKGTKSSAKISKAPPATVEVVVDEPSAASWKSTLDPLSAGGWTFLSDGPPENPSAVYASSHSILHNGNVVTAWMRWEFSRPQAEVYPLHYQSAVTREELDCDARAYRRAQVFYYVKNNLHEKGPSFTALDDDTNWKQAIPGTEPDAMLNWACTPPAAPHRAHVAKPKHDDDDDDADEAKTSSAPAAASSGPSAVPLSGPSSVSTSK